MAVRSWQKFTTGLIAGTAFDIGKIYDRVFRGGIGDTCKEIYD